MRPRGRFAWGEGQSVSGVALLEGVRELGEQLRGATARVDNAGIGCVICDRAL